MNIWIILLICWVLWLIFRKKKTELPRQQEKSTSPSTMSYSSRASRSKESVSPDSVWIPQGRSIEISGYKIESGLLYVGSGLNSVSGWSVEPAMINPNLPVDNFVLDKQGNLMRYWPSYSEVAPASRSAYLHWLSEGKKDPEINIGYVFLYFYGLERRLLSDILSSEAVKAEVNIIIDEVKRLLSIYNANSSFNNYASKFLDYIRYKNSTCRAYAEMPPQELPFYGYEVPLSIQVAFAQAALDCAPLPAAWALAAVKNNPMRRLRTPAQRCDDEFGKLFCLRYNEKYGNGLKLSKGKGKMRYSYKPASASFGNTMSFTLDGFPNVIGVDGQMNKLYDIAENCINDLDAYSRYVGRKPQERNSLEALSLLPDQIIAENKSDELTVFRAWLNNSLKAGDPCVLDYSTLLSHFPSIDAQNIRKQDLVAISQVLAKFEVGIEPDIRFGSPKPSYEQKIVLFKNSATAPNAPSHAYSVAAVILQLAAAVSFADDKIASEEERHLESQLEKWLHLGADEKTRLRAFTRWILSVPASYSGMKNKIALFSEKQCETVGRFLVGVAQADGIIDAVEIKILTKIYKMLGLDVQSLYSHAHSAATAPVTIETGSFDHKAFSIPTASQEKSSPTVDLNMESIKVKLAETAAVTALLNDIFIEDETKLPVTEQVQSDEVVPGIAGLDAEHSAFARVLAEQLSWSRSDLEALAGGEGLLLDGALDSINDAAIEAYGSPLFEGDDPLEVDPTIAKEILR